MNKEELLYNEIYERTKDFGRNQFVREIMNLQRENKELQQKVNQLEKKIKSLTSKNTSKKIYGEYKHVRLTEKEFQMLIECYGEEQTKQLITYLDEYIEMKDYKAKNHYLCIKKWVVEAIKEKKYKYNKQPIREEKMPSWFGKEIKAEPLTPEEQAEMDELLKKFN